MVSSLELVFCPGYHRQDLGDRFCADLALPEAIALHAYPATVLPPYSPFHILSFMDRNIARCDRPVLMMGFSAGVVGAITAAKQWQRLGGQIEGLIAIDGWGVPLGADFPIYRLSCDRLSHKTAQLWGMGSQNFYADPPVAHLDLLRSPYQLKGWRLQQDWDDGRSPTTLGRFLLEIIGNLSLD